MGRLGSIPRGAAKIILKRWLMSSLDRSSTLQSPKLNRRTSKQRSIRSNRIDSAKKYVAGVMSSAQSLQSVPANLLMSVCVSVDYLYAT